jgi:hypothetical protein
MKSTLILFHCESNTSYVKEPDQSRRTADALM